MQRSHQQTVKIFKTRRTDGDSTTKSNVKTTKHNFRKNQYSHVYTSNLDGWYSEITSKGYHRHPYMFIFSWIEATPDKNEY